jgi:DNA polymerase III subunit chi
VQVDFYHLTRMPLERALPRIAERVVGSGARLLIVSALEDQRSALDRLLWQFAPDSFLPHGLAGGAHDDRQPILIAGDVAPANGARHVAMVDGEWRDAALGFERAFHFFDEEAIGAARAAWKGLAGREDIERRYWKQNDAGKWEQAA